MMYPAPHSEGVRGAHIRQGFSFVVPHAAHLPASLTLPVQVLQGAGLEVLAVWKAAHSPGGCGWRGEAFRGLRKAGGHSGESWG